MCSDLAVALSVCMHLYYITSVSQFYPSKLSGSLALLCMHALCLLTRVRVFKERVCVRLFCVALCERASTWLLMPYSHFPSLWAFVPLPIFVVSYNSCIIWYYYILITCASLQRLSIESCVLAHNAKIWSPIDQNICIFAYPSVPNSPFCYCKHAHLKLLNGKTRFQFWL